MTQGPGPCKACEQYSRDRTSGYCPPCWDEYRAMVDEWDIRQRELDRESAESYAEYDLKDEEESGE